MEVEISPELAEICGIHAGDGYLRGPNKRAELDISGGLEEKEYYDIHVVPLFAKTFGIELKAREFPSRRTYGFVIRDKAVIAKMHSLGFPYGKKTLTVKVPEQVLRSKNLDVIYGFLRGLFDTDGTLSFRKRGGAGYNEVLKKRHTYPLIRLRVCSKNLRDGVGQLLMRTGFQFTFSHHKSNGQNNESFGLALDGDMNAFLWMYNLGFKNPLKANRFLIWKKHGFNPPWLTFKQEKEILDGKTNPHDYYTEKLSDEAGVLPRLVKRRLDLIQSLETLTFQNQAGLQ